MGNVILQKIVSGCERLRVITAMVAVLGIVMQLICMTNAQAEETRTSLKLNGGRITDLASSADGSLVYAAVESPYGMYSSKNFGATWERALGGDYVGGWGKAVVVGSTRVYAILDRNAVYWSSLADVNNWQRLSLADGAVPESLHVDASTNMLLIGTTSGKLFAVSTVDNTVLGESTISDGNAVSGVTYDAINSIVYTEVSAEFMDKEHFKATLTVSPFSLSDWQSITANIGITSRKFSGLSVDPDGKVYISTFNAGGDEDGVYRSETLGQTFTKILSPTNAVSSSFVGDVYLVGSYLSQDGGYTWQQLANETSGEYPLHLSSNLNLINPANSQQAIVGSDVGMVVTSALSQSVGDAGESVWASAVNGIEGVSVTDIAQLDSKKSRAFVATNTQLAFTDSFTSPAPTWLFPIMPMGDGGGAEAVAIKPNNANVLFAGTGRLYMGIVDDSTHNITFTWSQLFDPFALGLSFPRIKDIAFSSESSNKLFVSYSQQETGINGGLGIVDLETNSVEQVSVLLGKPVGQLLIVSSELAFAAVGIESDNTTIKGIYRCSSDCYSASADWEREKDDVIPADIFVNKFVYNKGTDTVYVAANSGILYLKTASNSLTWASAGTEGMTDRGRITALALEEATGDLYAATLNLIYVSRSGGTSWSKYFEGLPGEESLSLFFDDLVQGSNAGFYAFDNSPALTSPAYTYWNGFLNMQNTLELTNPSSVERSVNVSMFDHAGAKLSSRTYKLAAWQERSISINALKGFKKNNYGTIKLSFQGRLSGRVSYLRPKAATNSTDSGAYEVAYSLPIADALRGRSYVSFNTLQPSQHAEEADYIVRNWLSILNPSSKKMWFTVKFYRFDGKQIRVRRIPVKAGSVVDIDAGSFGEVKTAGLCEIIPDNHRGNYLAKIVRYGRIEGDLHHWAFPLVARGGGQSEEWVGISKSKTNNNWLELVNTTSRQITTRVTLFNNRGTKLTKEPLTYKLKPHGQTHINIGSYLPNGSSGTARILSPTGSIIANSMYYYLRSDGRVEGTFGLQSKVSRSGEFTSTWNLRLSQENWLRIANTGIGKESVTITVLSQGKEYAKTISLKARQGSYLPLHNTATYKTVKDSSGIVKVTGNNINVDLIRLRPADSAVGNVDYAYPIAAER